MVREPVPEASTAVGWVQNELYQIKADIGHLEQQVDQVRTLSAQAADQLRAVELSLRDVTQNASHAPRVQEELNQTIALVVQLQDQQAEVNTRLDVLGRQRDVDDVRDQDDWSGVVRRVDELERKVELWQDRQAGVDEVGRRFQEGLSVVRQQLQQIEKRLDMAESKAARGLEGATRAENTLTQVEASVLALQREDETIAERARVAADVGHRLESTISQHVSEFQRVELLAERIELHRAERQRLEDRALRLEEELGELRTRLERDEQSQGRIVTQNATLSSKLNDLAEQLSTERSMLLEKMRKLTNSQERTKRAQIQQLERELREMRQYVADLAEQ